MVQILFISFGFHILLDFKIDLEFAILYLVFYKLQIIFYASKAANEKASNFRNFSFMFEIFW